MQIAKCRLCTVVYQLSIYIRCCVGQVMSGREFASLSDWLGCSKPLCPVVVRDTGRIEDAEPGLTYYLSLMRDQLQVRQGKIYCPGREQTERSVAAYQRVTCWQPFQM